MVTTTLADADLGTLAQLLFTGPVQPSEHSSRAAIRKAVATQFRRYHGDLTACLGVIAQEAGDHPDIYLARMRWAIRSVTGAYSPTPGSRRSYRGTKPPSSASSSADAA